MTGLTLGDASFFYMETDKTPTHAAMVQLYDVPPEEQDTLVDDLKRLMVERRHLVHYLTHRVRFVPGNLDHPVWVDDGNFDPDYHIQSIDLGGNGTMRDLEETVAKLHEGRMPRDRPLWRIVVIKGLENGRAAYYQCMHHACLDGMGGQEPLYLLADTGPEPRRVIPEDKPPEKEPSALELLMGAATNLTRASFMQWSAVPQALRTGSALVSRLLDSRKSFGAYANAFQAPKTSLNVEIDGRRAFAVGRLPLGDVKAIGKKLSLTVNDVIMGVTAGGLRRYLERRDELPEEPLIAGVPVSLREPGDNTQNNQVTTMLVSLETQRADPVERLLKIAESARIGKEVTKELFSGGSSDVRMLGLPNLFAGAVQLAERTHLTERFRMPINVTISSVPGPKDQLYSNGCKMIGLFPVSLPLHGAGVNLTTLGFKDNLDFSITAAKVAMAEPQELRDDILAAFGELRELVLDTAAGTSSGEDPLAA